MPRLTAADVTSVGALALALVKNSKAQRVNDKAELAFKWVAMNIRYDIESYRVFVPVLVLLIREPE